MADTAELLDLLRLIRADVKAHARALGREYGVHSAQYAAAITRLGRINAALASSPDPNR